MISAATDCSTVIRAAISSGRGAEGWGWWVESALTSTDYGPRNRAPATPYVAKFGGCDATDRPKPLCAPQSMMDHRPTSGLLSREVRRSS